MDVTPERVVEWCERQQVGQGRRAGQPFDLYDWQREAIAALYGEQDAQRAAVSIARGGGKTTFLGLIGACCLAGPLAQPRGEVVCVASSLAQAKLVFEAAKSVLHRKLTGSGGKRWRQTDSLNLGLLKNLDNGASLKCISSDPKRAHGLAPALAILDEPAQWPEGTRDAMFAALKTSLGKLPASKLFAIGTRPPDGSGHFFERMLKGGADWSLTYSAEPGDDPFDPATWRKANPDLDRLPDLAQAIASDARDAERDPADLQAFKALRLNLGVGDVESSVLLPAVEWQAAESGEPAEGPYALGLDLATSSFAGAAAYWPETGRLDGLLACAAEPDLHARGRAAGVGTLYVEAHERGELLVAGSQVVDIRALIDDALARWGAPEAIAADRWRVGELRQVLADAFAGLRAPWLHERGAGYRDSAEDVRAFKRLFYAGDILPVESLVLRDSMRNARLQYDPAGNPKLRRHGDDRRRRAPDDLAAAAILAAGVADREPRIVRPSQRAALAVA